MDEPELILAETAVAAGLDRWSPRAAEMATAAVADTLAVGVAGMAEAPARHALATVVPCPAPGSAPLWRGPHRYQVTDAAFVTGVATHSLDWDDYMHPMHGHCSSVLLAATWGLVESRGGTGADLLAAFLAGYQVDYLASLAFGTAHYERGWHATSTVGTLGAAAAAAQVLRLDPARAGAALAIAASMAAGLRVNFGTQTKPLHAGAAARNGVHAALLAAAGATGSERWLTGHHGMLDVFGGEPDREGRLAAIGDAAGGPHGIETEWGLVQKPYCCCGSCHAAVDAVIDLAGEMDATAESIERIEVHVDPIVPGIMRHGRPANPYAARYSLPWAIAAAAADRAAGPAQFSEHALGRPELHRLASRVTVAGDLPAGDHDRFAARVSLTSGGRTAHRHVPHASGHPLNPLTDRQRTRKQLAALGPTLGRDAATAVLDALSRLAQPIPLSELGDRIRAASLT